MIDNNMTDPHVQTLVAQAAAAAAPHGVEIYIEPIPAYLDRLRLHVGYRTESYWSPTYHFGDLTDEHLTDLIAFFTNRPIDKDEIMNIYKTDLFTYLAGDMIGAKNVIMTITGVTEESMNSGRGGQQTKPCLHFKESAKKMVLNKTNAKTLAGELGPETDDWIGARVTIAAPVVDAFGKSARSLRVIKVETPQIAVKSRNGNGNGSADVADAATALADEIEAATIRQYGDGSHVGAAAVAHYDAYVAAHGDAPADADDLRQWVNEQQQPA